MRKKATLLNSIAGLVNRIVTIIFVFLVRHYFVQSLDVEYLGLEGFFSNVLGLFSLVDLGFGAAISFDLFEPLHKNDREQISSIMALYKKLYICVGIVIFVLSVCFTPFILNFIKDNTIPGDTIRLNFLVYAFGVSVSYFFSYKRTLLYARQKNHIILNIDTGVKIIQSLAQILILLRFENYTLYLMTLVIANVSSNVLVSWVSDKENAYDKSNIIPLQKEYKDKLKRNVIALAVTNVSWQGISSTDNIIISSLVGVIDLAKNANYVTITHSIINVVTSILGGVTASIGDLIAEKNDEKIRTYFDRYFFIYYIVASYASLGVLLVSDKIIEIWVGLGFVLDRRVVIVISINLFLNLIFRPLADYQNYSGCFIYYKPYSIVALIINIVTSILLSLNLGLIGVFLGTTITYSFMIISVASILFRHVFRRGFWGFILNFFVFIIPAVIAYLLLNSIIFLYDGNILMVILFRIISVSIIYFLCVCIVFWKSNLFRFYWHLLPALKKIIREKDN